MKSLSSLPGPFASPIFGISAQPKRPSKQVLSACEHPTATGQERKVSGGRPEKASVGGTPGFQADCSRVSARAKRHPSPTAGEPHSRGSHPLKLQGDVRPQDRAPAPPLQAAPGAGESSVAAGPHCGTRWLRQAHGPQDARMGCSGVLTLQRDAISGRRGLLL